MLRFRFFIPFFLFVIFISCSQEVPDVRYSKYSVIFKYDSLENTPSCSFSLFLDTTNSSNRSKSITLKSEANNYIWECDELSLFYDRGNYFSGCCNFVMPENQLFPTGNYNIEYETLDGQKVTYNVLLNYDGSFIDVKGQDVSDIMMNKNAKKNIMIFDSEKNVLFYGQETTDLNTNRKIWYLFPGAKYKKTVWQMNDNTVFCLLPETEIVPDDE